MQWPIEARRCFNKGLDRGSKSGLYFLSWFVSKRRVFHHTLEEDREGSEYCRERWRRARSAERIPSAGAGLGAPRLRRRRQRATITAPRKGGRGPRRG